MSSGLKTSSISRQNTGSDAPYQSARPGLQGCSIRHLQRVEFSLRLTPLVSGYGGKCSKQHRGAFGDTAMQTQYTRPLWALPARIWVQNSLNVSDKILMECLLVICSSWPGTGNGAYFPGNQLLGIYSSDPQVIQVRTDFVLSFC